MSGDADYLDRSNEASEKHDMQISPTTSRPHDHPGGDRDKFAVGLQIVSQEGIILPSFEDGCRFLHDRYSQAAYMLVNEKARNKMHLKIGEMLLKGNWILMYVYFFIS